MRIILFLFLCSLPRFNFLADLSSLKLVHVYFRHGSRTPALQELYPGFVDKNDFIKTLGYKQITKEGKQMMYSLGGLLKKRYGDFLKTSHPHDIVYTRSTYIDRTKISALAVLAGLFPPDPSEKLQPDLNWTPIPYHYQENDYEFQMPIFICPAHVKEHRRVLESDEVKKYIEDNMSTFEAIKNVTGSQTTLAGVFNMTQGFAALSALNIDLPKWATESFLHSLEKLAVQDYKFLSHNTLLKRLLGGRALKATVNNLQAVYESSYDWNNKKIIYLNSVHDTNVGGILSLFDMLDHVPRFGSTFILELHNSTSGYTVKTFYIEDPYSEPQEKYIPGCGASCTLEIFLNVTKPYIPVNIMEECNAL